MKNSAEEISPANFYSNSSVVKLNISTAKNSILPLLVATLMNCEKTIFQISDMFHLKDVDHILSILNSLDVATTKSTSQLILDATAARAQSLSVKAAAGTRYSLLFLGAMTARFGSATVPIPGGCNLGRGHDFHVEVLRSLGCQVIETQRGITAKRVDRAHPLITLPYPSVGTTLNAIFGATTALPQVGNCIRLENCAQEPEIDDVLHYINKLGVEAMRDGLNIIIHPVEKIQPRTIIHSPIRDRIEAGTYAIAALILGEKIILRHAPVEFMGAVLKLLIRLECQVHFIYDSLVIDGRNFNRTKGLELLAEPYPGFPTDLQPIIAVLCLCLEQQSSIRDFVMPMRTQYLDSLRAQGADIEATNSQIIIRPGLSCEDHERNHVSVTATDLRGGMAALLLALNRGAHCEIQDFFQIRRGYSQIDNVVNVLGGMLKQA